MHPHLGHMSLLLLCSSLAGCAQPPQFECGWPDTCEGCEGGEGALWAEGFRLALEDEWDVSRAVLDRHVRVIGVEITLPAEAGASADWVFIDAVYRMDWGRFKVTTWKVYPGTPADERVAAYHLEDVVPSAHLHPSNKLRPWREVARFVRQCERKIGEPLPDNWCDAAFGETNAVLIVGSEESAHAIAALLPRESEHDVCRLNPIETP